MELGDTTTWEPTIKLPDEDPVWFAKQWSPNELHHQDFGPFAARGINNPIFRNVDITDIMSLSPIAIANVTSRRVTLKSAPEIAVRAFHGDILDEIDNDMFLLRGTYLDEQMERGHGPNLLEFTIAVSASSLCLCAGAPGS